MRHTLLSSAVFMFSLSGFSQDSAIARVNVAVDSASDPTNTGRKDSAGVAPAATYVSYLDTGIASWYGPHWEGRLTSSGEYFSPDSMTAAHKWLPFGTIVKVTNLKNDSVIYVRITDRLPKSSTRSIDLTPVAAKRLGFYRDGLQKVRMETVGITPVKRKTKSKGAAQQSR